MSNEVVKYHNQFNTVAMRKWTTEEMNFMFAILSKAKNQGTKQMVFTKVDLVELTNYSQKNNIRLVDVMEQLGEHVIQMRYKETNGASFKIMNLFQTFSVDWNKEETDFTLKVSVHEQFEYILNKFEINFTDFRLDEYVSLKSTYSKELYRQLKAWKKVGKVEFTVEEFKEKLSIPASYRADAILRRVLQPIQKELSKYFVGLKVAPIKKKTKGNPIIAYRFTWRPETTNDWVAGQIQTRHDQPKGTKKRKGTVKLGMPEYYNKPVEEVTEPASQESLDKVKEMLDRMNNTPADGQTTIEDFIEEEKK